MQSNDTLQTQRSSLISQLSSRDSLALDIAAWLQPEISSNPDYEWESYVNKETGRLYQPHHKKEELFVYRDTPRYGLAKGGEGGGKSVSGIIKTLERVRRGMSGIMVSPDFEHFKKSLWPEYRRWCAVGAVIERERYRLRQDWEPQRPFELHFNNAIGGLSTIYCGGIEDPSGWEGPNVSFVHFDEARRHNDAAALKVLDGRVRIPGPKGEPPQIFITTTPKKHWLFDYFGGVDTDDVRPDDPLKEFKQDAYVITLLTKDNEINLEEGFAAKRRQTLTEQEARVLLEAQWEDVDDTDRFLSSMVLWDACEEELPTLDGHTPVVMGMDAGESSDTFATVLVSVHPKRAGIYAVRYARAYVPKNGPLDFDEIEKDIRDLCKRYAIRQIAYDPFLLGQMVRRLTTGKKATAIMEPFPQGAQRLEADKFLFDLILQRRIVHDGDGDLRSHIENADKKRTGDGRKMRITKRQQNLKIDLTVALSMAAHRCANLPAVNFTGLGLGVAKGW
jgi:hypothetical protein